MASLKTCFFIPTFMHSAEEESDQGVVVRFTKIFLDIVLTIN